MENITNVNKEYKIMTTVYIAEKPDIGRTLAEYLWHGNAKKEKGFIYNSDIIVTWAFGHILGLAMPEAYGIEYKSWQQYPILPSPFKLVPAMATKPQLNLIQKLLATADLVIHAGDPDREGQLLIDEIIKFCHYQGPVQRLLINAKDNDSLKLAFDNITDNAKFHSLYEAGLAREQADWLVGMNLSRAYTVQSQKYGWENVLRIGRVKIPTLALVVKREKEIQDFQTHTFFVLSGSFQKDRISFKAKWQPKENTLVDSENRVTDKNILLAIKEKLAGKTALIQSIEKRNGTEYPPLPHSLDTLQVEANKLYGFSPTAVLKTVQDLYEQKLVSYPRSDCNYIPSSQKAAAAKILATLTKVNCLGADKADTALVSKAWNDKKITAHHAIIPTGVDPCGLSEISLKIYNLIAKNYILQFFSPHTYEEINYKIQIGDEIFQGRGKITLQNGFREVFKSSEGKSLGDGENNVLPPCLAQNDCLAVNGYEINEQKTKPPKRFTEGTLLSAMANIWKYMGNDNPNRDKLKEVKGIGTPATRDTIIASLLTSDIKGHYTEPCLKKSGKELIPTEFGKKLIDIIEPSLTIPDTTAEMELALSEIIVGKCTAQDYLDSVIQMVLKNISHAETMKWPYPPSKEIIPCPICKKGTLIRKYSPKTKSYFHICDNVNCSHPITRKAVYYIDKDGKPVIARCPENGTILERIKKKDSNYFWKCPECNQTFSDKNCEPVLKANKEGDS
jgi:DNA topoisomerase-3